jgi:hypothetical protein
MDNGSVPYLPKFGTSGKPNKQTSNLLSENGFITWKLIVGNAVVRNAVKTEMNAANDRKSATQSSNTLSSSAGQLQSRAATLKSSVQQASENVDNQVKKVKRYRLAMILKETRNDLRVGMKAIIVGLLLLICFIQSCSSCY